MTDTRYAIGPLCRALLVRTIAIACILLVTGAGCSVLVALSTSVFGEIARNDPSGQIDLLLGLLTESTGIGARGALLAFPCALPLLLATNLRRSAPLIAAGALLGSLADWGPTSPPEGELWLYAPGYAGAGLGWCVGALLWRRRFFEDPRDPDKLAWPSRADRDRRGAAQPRAPDVPPA